MTKFNIPDSLKRSFKEGELRRNLPVILKTNCAQDGKVVSMDGLSKYEELEFIPLRIDYTRSVYDGREMGLLLAICCGGSELQPVNGKIVRRPMPKGMSFYLMMNRNNSGTGPLDSFENMSVKLEQITGIVPQGWIWCPSFEAKTGMILENGQPKPIAYSRLQWLVREVDQDSKIEQSFINEIADLITDDSAFENICPVNNKAIAKFDELAAIAQLKSSESKALPQS